MSEEAKAGSIHFCIVHLWAFACYFLSLPVKLFFGGNLRKKDKKPLILFFECISPISSCLTLKASRITGPSFPPYSSFPKHPPLLLAVPFLIPDSLHRAAAGRISYLLGFRKAGRWWICACLGSRGFKAVALGASVHPAHGHTHSEGLA